SEGVRDVYWHPARFRLPGEDGSVRPIMYRRRSMPSLLRSLVLLLTLGLPGLAQAAIHHQHGYSVFGQPKYPAQFTHFDYVNPQAPKGGTLRVMGSGTFDTLNPYTL